MTKRRGSAAVLAMIMILATATLALVTIGLSNALRTKETRLETNRIIKNAWDGGLDTIRDMAARGVLRLPQTVSITVGSVQESLALTDSSSGSVTYLGTSVTVGSPSILVVGTLTYNGNTWTKQRIIGRGLLSTVWQYALYDDANLSSSSNLTTGSVGLGGDVWVDGDINLSGASTQITGDLTATGNISPGNINVTGIKTSKSASITFPSVSSSTYQAAALVSSPIPLVVNGMTFFSGSSSGYSLIYVNGTLSIKGNFVGSGVFYATGDVTIAGDITKSSTDHVVIITPGKINVSSSAVNVAAYLYCGNTFTITSAGVKRYFTGGIVANNVSLGDDLSASFDTTARDDQNEAWRLKLPGCWP